MAPKTDDPNSQVKDITEYTDQNLSMNLFLKD